VAEKEPYERAVVILPVVAQAPVAGWYRYALVDPGPLPPARRTWPFCRSVAVEALAVVTVVMLPVAAQVPDAWARAEVVGANASRSTPDMTESRSNLMATPFSNRVVRSGWGHSPRSCGRVWWWAATDWGTSPGTKLEYRRG
jgi:hypothetical protein